MNRVVPAALVLASLSWASAAAQGPVSPVACQPPAVGRSHRSSSAKSSVPTRGAQGDALGPRLGSGGATSAKASTPLGAASRPSDGHRTAGSLTPKGSMPVPAVQSCAQ